MKKQTKEVTKNKETRKLNIRVLTAIGMLSAIAYILMLLQFPIPLMPTFIKLDFSDLPALIGGLAYGPLAGMFIALVKNVLHLPMSMTGGVGELSNFILSASFVMTASIFYKRKKTKRAAIIGSVVGALIMTIASIVSNYYIVYPIYSKIMPFETIIGLYQAILPSVGVGTDPLMEVLLIFNAPFTFVKAMLSVLLTIFIYKPLSPLLHGRK